MKKKWTLLFIFYFCFSFQNFAQKKDSIPINKSSTKISLSSLGDRGVLKQGKINPTGAVNGIISVNLCADKDGKVIPSSILLNEEKTTVTNQEVIQKVLKTVKLWEFDPSEKERECGILTYVLKPKKE